MNNRKSTKIGVLLITIIIIVAGAMEAFAQESYVKWLLNMDPICSADLRVTTVIDADIEMHGAPDAVATTVPHTITPEEMQQWTEVLFSGNTAYEYDSSKTREVIISLIDQTQMWLDNLDPDVEPEIYDYRKGLYQSEINKLEELLENAADEYPQKTPDWTYKSEEVYSDRVKAHKLDPSENNQMIKVYADIDGETAFSECRTFEREDFILNKYTFWIRDGYQKKTMEESEEAVCAYVEGKLSELGFADKWMIKSCKEKYQKEEAKDKFIITNEGYYYDLTLIPVYEGCEVLENQEIMFNSTDYAGKKYMYYYESLDIQYSNGHIVYLEYNAPLETADSTKIDKLLDFDDVLNIFEDYMKSISVDEYQNGMTLLQENIEVKKIDFGLVRVRIDSHKPVFMMTPVWVFYGSISRDYGEGLKSGYPGEVLEPVLMISAVDGNIIDMEEQW